MSRILFVTSRLPWPTDSGRKVSLWHYCRGLAARGHSVSLFVFPEWDQPRSAADKPDFIERVYFSEKIRKGEKLKNLLCRAAVGKARWPLQCALYYSKANARAIARAAEEIGADTVLFDMIRTAPYMNAPFTAPVRKILDLDDLLSRRYERQLAGDAGSNGVAGRYGGGMAPAAERLLCRGRIGRMVLKAEQKRLKKAEIAFSEASDGVILVSAEETAYLNTLLKSKEAFAVPMGVDVDAFTAADGVAKESALIGFVGNMHVAANADSLAYIADEVLPLMPPCTLEVVGTYPEEIAKRYENSPNVVLRGRVEAIPPVAGRWQLMLSPITFGSGIKTKILEAMAMALPVVTNAVGAESIDDGEGTCLLQAETAEELAAAATRVLHDPAYGAALGHAARDYVKAHFSWEQIFEEFAHLGL